MRTLVIGSSGQIGIGLVAELAKQGHEIHAADIVAQPDLGHLGPNIHRHVLDVTSEHQIRATFEALRPERVFHLAAILSAAGESDPQSTYRVNQTGTYHVLEAARIYNVAQVMFASTIAVFGPDLPNPVGDDVSLAPTTMYGVTKVAGELLGAYYHRKYGLDFRGLRFPGLISATRPGGGTSDYALFMYTEGVRIGRYRAFCRPDTRIPLMYMPDALRAWIELSDAPNASLSRRVYNVAGFSPTAREIADRVRGALPAVELSFVPDPARQAILDSWPEALDDRCAQQDWGWKAAFDLQGMTDDLVPALRDLVARTPDALRPQSE